jgi:GTP-binding protein HflX
MNSGIQTSTRRHRESSSVTTGGRVGEYKTTMAMNSHNYRSYLMFLAVFCLTGGTTAWAFQPNKHSYDSISRSSTPQTHMFQERQCRAPMARTVWGSSRLLAKPDPSEEPSVPSPLIPTDLFNNEDDDDYEENDDYEEASSFYDIDYVDDNESETSATNEGELEDLSEFVRENAAISQEQEDRFYVDEYGSKRKIETCILIAVEDVNAKRRDQRNVNMPGSDAGAFPDLDAFDTTVAANAAATAAAGARKNTRTKNDDGVYFTLEESLTEMRELIKTAGLELVGEIVQRLHEVNPKTYIGSGKVIEAQALLKEKGSCTVIFDAELSPGQQKSLENAFNKDLLQNDFLGKGEINVVDRTALILDIFAQHAKTREGKLQVDLALHEYRKPRLTKMWTHLERQSGAGGVGLRGPGESQLEIDRRLVRDRITVLKQKIDDVQKQRAMHRRGRERTGLPILSLVGYTNAGKSTLLNFLTRAGVMAESMLFATLDPTTRKVKLPGFKTHPEVLLTDTVGFIQKLPTHLIAAFRATLEEVKEADVLIHVIDVSNPMWEKQERSVMSVLADIGCSDKPMVRVLNKIDLLDPDEQERMRYDAATTDNTVVVSSLLGEGMQDFVSVVEEALADMLVSIEVEIPYNNGDELNIVHEQGNVEVVDYREKGTYVRALVPAAVANRLEKFNVYQAPLATDGGDNDDGIDWVALGRGRHSVTNDKLEN